MHCVVMFERLAYHALAACCAEVLVMQVLPASDAQLSTYVHQSYTHGDHCDITGETRQTEVQVAAVACHGILVMLVLMPCFASIGLTISLLMKHDEKTHKLKTRGRLNTCAAML